MSVIKRYTPFELIYFYKPEQIDFPFKNRVYNKWKSELTEDEKQLKLSLNKISKDNEEKIYEKIVPHINKDSVEFFSNELVSNINAFELYVPYYASIVKKVDKLEKCIRDIKHFTKERIVEFIKKDEKTEKDRLTLSSLFIFLFHLYDLKMIKEHTVDHMLDKLISSHDEYCVEVFCKMMKYCDKQKLFYDFSEYLSMLENRYNDVKQKRIKFIIEDCLKMK